MISAIKNFHEKRPCVIPAINVLLSIALTIIFFYIGVNCMSGGDNATGWACFFLTVGCSPWIGLSLIWLEKNYKIAKAAQAIQTPQSRVSSDNGL